jgi:hypothetical protein
MKTTYTHTLPTIRAESLSGRENKRLLLSADFEHLCATNGANTLGGRAAILHGDGPGVLYFPLGATFNTITLHDNPPQSTYQ